MKKVILSLAIIFTALVCSTNLFAVIGPIPINISNELPDGPLYGTVTVTLLPNYCSGTFDGVRIVADANQNILMPGTNFGIQDFGFNYNGDTGKLNITVQNSNGKWKVKTNQNMSEFGVFLYEDSGTGSTRQDPLVLDICHCCADLMEGNVVVKNSKGYAFAVHIADFTYNGVPASSSAFFSTIATTLIELATLTAIPGNTQATIQWTTESEIDNAGFNLYRSESKNGAYVQMNDALIPAEGSPLYGSFYEFVDDDVQNRKTYWYKLEDIDIYGKSTFHGPVSVMPNVLSGKGE